MRGARLSRWLVAVPMALLALATIYPLLFTANVAMKTRREYILDRFSLADSLRWDNIGTAWTSVGMARYFLNSRDRGGVRRSRCCCCSGRWPASR